jgi:hypothetical protein
MTMIRFKILVVFLLMVCASCSTTSIHDNNSLSESFDRFRSDLFNHNISEESEFAVVFPEESDPSPMSYTIVFAADNKATTGKSSIKTTVWIHSSAGLLKNKDLSQSQYLEVARIIKKITVPQNTQTELGRHCSTYQIKWRGPVTEGLYSECRGQSELAKEMSQLVHRLHFFVLSGAI